MIRLQEVVHDGDESRSDATGNEDIEMEIRQQESGIVGIQCSGRAKTLGEYPIAPESCPIGEEGGDSQKNASGWEKTKEFVHRTSILLFFPEWVSEALVVE